jgi:hypothetical protein
MGKWSAFFKIYTFLAADKDKFVCCVIQKPMVSIMMSAVAKLVLFRKRKIQ